MINLAYDTFYTWRFDGSGNLVNAAQDGSDNPAGYGPFIGDLFGNSLFYQSNTLGQAIGTSIFDNLPLRFHPDQADGFYVSGTDHLDYRFSGTDGNDYISALAHDFTANTGNGKDVVILEAEYFNFVVDDRIELGISGGDRNLRTGRDADYVFSETGGDNVIYGQAGDDVLLAYGANNTVFGGRGDDIIVAETHQRDGMNYVAGGRGHDTIMSAGDGLSTLKGGRGNDSLYSIDFAVRMFGGAGRDTLVAQGVENYVVGGAGADTFVFTHVDEMNTPFSGSDPTIYIKDFRMGVDQLVFDNGNLGNSDQFLGGVDTVYESNGAVTVDTENYGTITFEGLTVNDLMVLV